MLWYKDKVRTSVFPIAGSCISFPNGKPLLEHKRETRMIDCHCTGLPCPITSTPPVLSVEKTRILVICISFSCPPRHNLQTLWDCSGLNKNLLLEEQFSKKQMIADMFYKDSGMKMNICNLSCCRIQSNLYTRKDNCILNLRSEN